jgi:lipoate-protein ligase A
LNTQHATRNTQSWLLLESGPGDDAFNMAMDEALLEAMPRLQKPALRFYGWTERAASFGYFQKYPEIERATLLRPLVRRPTGGGLVPHDADWTYSLVFPTNHEWYATSAVESYRRVHEWIQAAFAEMKIATELAACCRKSAPGQCFAGYEKHDVLWHGKKIAGAAQRRNKLGLLIQGSVQPPPMDLKREDWEAAMRRAGAEKFGANWQAWKADAALSARVAELIGEKYSQKSYNEKR